MTNVPKIQIRNLQYAGFNGSYAAELHIDKELVAHVEDDGNGGGLFMDWTVSGGFTRSAARARLQEYCLTLPNVVRDWMPKGDPGLEQDMELLVANAIYVHLKAGKRGKIVKVEADVRAGE